MAASVTVGRNSAAMRSLAPAGMGTRHLASIKLPRSTICIGGKAVARWFIDQAARHQAAKLANGAGHPLRQRLVSAVTSLPLNVKTVTAEEAQVVLGIARVLATST
jgi:hypothetical protein